MMANPQIHKSRFAAQLLAIAAAARTPVTMRALGMIPMLAWVSAAMPVLPPRAELARAGRLLLEPPPLGRPSVCTST